MGLEKLNLRLAKVAGGIPGIPGSSRFVEQFPIYFNGGNFTKGILSKVLCGLVFTIQDINPVEGNSPRLFPQAAAGRYGHRYWRVFRTQQVLT